MRVELYDKYVEEILPDDFLFWVIIIVIPLQIELHLVGDHAGRLHQLIHLLNLIFVVPRLCDYQLVDEARHDFIAPHLMGYVFWTVGQSAEEEMVLIFVPGEIVAYCYVGVLIFGVMVEKIDNGGA